MVAAAFKALCPLAAAAALALQSLGGPSASPAGLTNVGGGPDDCVAPVRNGACASLFDGASPFYPGGPAQVRRVRIAYSGDRAATALGLFGARLVPRAARSIPQCKAENPADMLRLTVAEGGRTLYSGTLSEFATRHGSAPALLPLPGRWVPGAVHTYTLSVGLDAAAGNDYMGCASAVDLVWLAEE